MLRAVVIPTFRIESESYLILLSLLILLYNSYIHNYVQDILFMQRVRCKNI